MRNRKLLVLAAALLAGWAWVASAMDSPHDGSFSTSVTECQSCHRLHGSTGGTLLGGGYTSNNDACLQCHDNATSPNHFFSPAWSPTGREAVPGTGGDQHKWSGSPTERQARIPSNPAMAEYLPTGAKLQCAVCHDVHGARDATGVPVQDRFAPKSYHASYKLNDAQGPIGGGSGSLTLVSVDSGGWAPIPQGYAVRVKSAGVLEIAHDYKGLGTGTWQYETPFTADVDVPLDDPSVVVRISGTPSQGAVWQFYVSYPLLRASNVGDAMCTDCHADRKQGHLCVEGDGLAKDGTGASCTPNGARRYSHPVDEALGANGRGYDLGSPLDADGTVGSSATDSGSGGPNPSNDLKLDGTQVRCTTCHAPHNADSNSLTVEVR